MLNNNPFLAKFRDDFLEKDANFQDIPKQQLCFGLPFRGRQIWKHRSQSLARVQNGGHSNQSPARQNKSKMADKERCIGDISAFLSQSTREMEAILHKLRWNKEKLLKEVWKSKSKLHRPF